jgi:hypothetical protein
MIEREKLEREVHQLNQIIKADAFALVSKSTPIADRARLLKLNRPGFVGGSNS